MCAPRTPAARKRDTAAQLRRQAVVVAWVRAYKLAHGCADCGHPGHESGVDLDIDHMDGKTSAIPRLQTIAAVQAEIERHQCVVRCANCHRIKTWRDRHAQR